MTAVVELSEHFQMWRVRQEDRCRSLLRNEQEERSDEAMLLKSVLRNGKFGDNDGSGIEHVLRKHE